jgi:hypothetical protein
MKIGDKVKLIGIPPDAHDDNELQTRTLFERCLGKTFAVAGLETVRGHSGTPLISKQFGSNRNTCNPKRRGKF